MDDFSVLTGLLGYLDSAQEIELKSLHAQTWTFLLLSFVIWGKTPPLPLLSKSVSLKKALRMEEFQKYFF
jgi:hypothetical protein